MVGQVPCLTVHAVVADPQYCTRALKDCRKMLRKKYKIEHTTIQIEIEGEFDHRTETYGGLHRRISDCCIDSSGNEADEKEAPRLLV